SPAPWEEPEPPAYPEGEAGFPQAPADPRIGRSSRAGTLLAMLVAFVGVSAAAPVVGWGLLALWNVVARTADRTLTSLVLRRHANGPRRSAVPVTVLTSPLHLLSAVVGTVFALLLPAA